MSFQIYDRRILALHRNRIANGLKQYDFLFKASIEDIIDRAAFYNSRYEAILDLGCRTGHFSNYAKDKLGFSYLYQADLSRKMLDHAAGIRVNCDDELLPFAENSFDLIVSNLNLHWINRMFETMDQIKMALKPNGLFIATIIGGSSLRALRERLIKIELEKGTKVGLHISPMITADAMVQLAQKAGLTKIVVDSYNIEVKYDSPLQAMFDLQKMGESNCMNGKVHYMGKDICALLDRNPVTINFEIITLSAFKQDFL